jgi:hypothetical protein
MLQLCFNRIESTLKHTGSIPSSTILSKHRARLQRKGLFSIKSDFTSATNEEFSTPAL